MKFFKNSILVFLIISSSYSFSQKDDINISKKIISYILTNENIDLESYSQISHFHIHFNKINSNYNKVTVVLNHLIQEKSSKRIKLNSENNKCFIYIHDCLCNVFSVPDSPYWEFLVEQIDSTIIVSELSRSMNYDLHKNEHKLNEKVKW